MCKGPVVVGGDVCGVLKRLKEGQCGTTLLTSRPLKASCAFWLWLRTEVSQCQVLGQDGLNEWCCRAHLS